MSVQTNSEQFDVVICGAGPAGTTCALALGASGLKVALLDKSTFPRDKICGDAIAAYVPKVLNTIDPKYAKAIGDFTQREKVNCVRIVAPNEKAVDLKFSESGFISARLNFDNFLFDLAAQLPNVKTFLSTPLNDVKISPTGVTIDAGENLKLQAKLLIGCDGANGIVAKKLTNNKLDLKHHSGAVRAYYKNVSGIPSSTFELHFLKDILPGYFWIFPLPGNMSNVGLGLLSETISEKKINLRNEMQRIIETVPYIKERFEKAELLDEIRGYGLPLGSRKVTISGDNFMLCGDAAALIDPATGEGIGQAMVSGRYAGWQAMKCFEKNNFSAVFMKQYDKTVYDKLWGDHQRRYLVQRLINDRAWLINSAVNLAGRSKFLQRYMQKLIW